MGFDKNEPLFCIIAIALIFLILSIIGPKAIQNLVDESNTLDFPPAYIGHVDFVIETDGKRVWSINVSFNEIILESEDFAEVLENITCVASEAGGGVILIKSGTYIITQRHVIVRPYSDWVYFVGALIYKARNVMVVGEGSSTVLISDVNVTNPIYVYNAVNFTISNLVFDGAKHLQSRTYYDCYALIFNDGGGENITYHDLLLKNGKYMGIYIGNNDFLSEVVPPEQAWCCPTKNVIIYNVLTCNSGTGVFLDHVFNGKAFNLISVHDGTAIGFAGLSWEYTDKTFENVTVIDPVNCVFAGWYPQGKLKNINVYLSGSYYWRLFNFEHATIIEIENVTIYAKKPLTGCIFYSDGGEIKLNGEIKICKWQEPPLKFPV